MHPEPITTQESEANFLNACRFAKIVNTPSGTGILIGGEVFILNGPLTYLPNDGPDFTRLLVTALRGGTLGASSLSPATLG